MKNILLAFTISIFIHFLFLFTYETDKNPISYKNTKKVQKIQTVRYVKLKKKTITKEIVKKKKVEPTIYKKVIKEKFKKVEKREIVKKPKTTVPKPKTKTVVKPTYTKPLPKKAKKVIPKNQPSSKLEDMFTKNFKEKNKSLNEATEKIKKDTLNSFLSTPDIGSDMVDSITKSYLDLYGDEFKNFTKVQKVFLKKRLKDIGRITQRYMYYPNVSIRTKQQGTNILEFILYPNGDISSILLTSSSGYEPLDKSSVRTIQIAFKDYPRPKEATKIKIYMSYILY